MSDEIKNPATAIPAAEEFASTPPTVVAGLGYPNGRVENSPEPTGWLVNEAEVTLKEKQVSRETSR